MVIGLIREGKADSRVALTPKQCALLCKQNEHLAIRVQASEERCFTDAEYLREGIEVIEDMTVCDVLFGIKEVKAKDLIPEKTYFFFSHTKKLQPYNQEMFQAILQKKITLIDYECLEHRDGARVLGFGFFAGVVGAHNGMMAYGERTGSYSLGRVHKVNSFNKLIHTYFGLHLPAMKIAVTGSGRVAHGVLEIMNLMGIHEVEPDDYLEKEFDYPVYVHLKGANLYRHKQNGKYRREDFHNNPGDYESMFLPYTKCTDLLINGVYWDSDIPRLFELDDVKSDEFVIRCIADITDDKNGSIPCNLGDASITDPVYGVDIETGKKTAPYLQGSIDIMAVGNLPNELPRDASRYFGEQLMKFVLPALISGSKVPLLANATIVKKGKVEERYEFMKAYGGER